MHSDLYEYDYLEWLQETAHLLKSRKFDELDVDNLIEEIEAMVRNEKSAVKSLLEQIIRHRLMLDYWETEREFNSNHWQAEIINFRSQLEDKLTTNLKKYLEDELDRVYQRAVKYLKAKTKEQVNFPDECIYLLEELLND